MIKLPLRRSNILGDNIGFITFLECMGNDESIVNAARISTTTGESLYRNPNILEQVQDEMYKKDRHLIRFLMKYRHTSPFEMCEIKMHVKAPMFIARQWVRHRTANYNEYSARYSEMINDFYYPSKDMMQRQSKFNNQMSDGTTYNDDEYNAMINAMHEANEHSWKVYEDMISHNVARETARGVLPVNIYTELYWKIDAHNLMHFLNLRCKSEAQQEIRLYALEILDFMKNWLPLTHEAFEDYVLNAHTMSKYEMDILRECVDRDKFTSKIDACDHMTKREKNVMQKLFAHSK